MVEVIDKVWEWSPFKGWFAKEIKKQVIRVVDVVETICDDIDYDLDWSWSTEKEWWIPFFTIPLLTSSAKVVDKFKILKTTESPITVQDSWQKTLTNYSWTQDIGPSAVKLNAYAGYGFDLLLKGLLYSYYKPNDQIAGHPFNYYASVDGDESGAGLMGGWIAAGYGLQLKIPYLNEWVELIGYQFNTSELPNFDLPIFETEYSVGVAALSISAEAEYKKLDELQIEQSAYGFLGEWTTTPFFTMEMSLDGKLFEVINMNLGSITVDFLLKGVGALTGDITASGAGFYPSHTMSWDKPGDINYVNIYPNPTSSKGDIIDVLIQNLKYNLNLSLVIRISGKLYAQKGYLELSHDFEIPIENNINLNVKENISDKIPISAGFNPVKITDYPSTIEAGTPFTIFWETANSSNGRTRLHVGRNNNPNLVYTFATNNKNITTSGINKFNETIVLNQTGYWYFAAILLSYNPPFIYNSKIYRIYVKPKLTFVSVPQNVSAGQSFEIKWNIFGPSYVRSTNVLWSRSPNPVRSAAKSTQIQSGGQGNYSTNLKIDRVGTYYIVARAKIDLNETEYFTEVKSIKVIPYIRITVLPTPNNASISFRVNWSIIGANHVDRTYLEYCQYSNFSKNVYSTRSQFGYKQNFADNISIYVKGIWYLRVLASVDGIGEVYYSILPLNTTEIYPYSEINPGYPRNVTANTPFKLYWWVFGFATNVSKTQIYYDNDTNVFDNPIGKTTPKSGNLTEFYDTFTISTAGRYYFQANFTVDGENKSWNSSIISIFVEPVINITHYPENATAFTHFEINYDIIGLDTNITLIDLWYGESENISLMSVLNDSVKGGVISVYIPETGLYYFALNLTFDGKLYWSEIFSIMILPNITIKIPWNDIPKGQSQTNPDLSPGQFAIAGIPVTFEWIISNVSTVNHTDIHFQGVPNLEPTLVPIVADYYRYDFTSYTLTTGWKTPTLVGKGAHYYIFRQNITFYTKEFKWVFFKIHAKCDNKTFDYYSESSGIAVYPAAETIEYNYSVVVDKMDISTNPRNFTITWAMGYIIHNWTAGPVNNSPNYPGIVPHKVIGIKHANIHYCLNYDPINCYQKYGVRPMNTTDHAGSPPIPGIFKDTITINSTGTYYFRIHIRYQYASNDENFTYPQHINRSYWSPLYKIHVLSFGKYNTSVKFNYMTQPPPVDYGDFDNDGDLDMIVGRNDLSVPKVVIYYNDGTGNYTSIPPRVIDNTASILEIRTVKVGYFNSDDHLDFLMTNESGLGPNAESGYVFINNGLGDFNTSYKVFGDRDEIYSYTTADINHDGIYDYIYYDYSFATLFLDYGTNGGYTPFDARPMGFIETLQAKKMDQNNDSELIIGFNNGSVGIFVDYPMGSLKILKNVSINSDKLNHPLIGDFNNDGYNDTITVNKTGAVILTINATKPVHFNKIIGTAGDKTPNGLAAGDFDNDGDLDFVIGNDSNTFQFFFNNNSMGPYKFPGFSSCYSTVGGIVITTSDFNLDGYLDISSYKSNYIIHYLNNYIPPPTITNVSVSYDPVKQLINITNVDVICSEEGEINNTNAYVHLFTILNGTFAMTDIIGNLTWSGNSWEALNIDVSSLPEGVYYINITFGSKYSFGNNSYNSQKNANFTVDHYLKIIGINVSYSDGLIQRLNITIDNISSSYSILGNLTDLEAKICSYMVYNSTGYNTSVWGNFTYDNTTGIYKWEAINISTSKLAPGDYYITINFSDYLGYGQISVNTSLFTISHTIASDSTPIVSYNGNYSQIINIKNILVKSTYELLGYVGKGVLRQYNYSIFYSNNTFTGLRGKLDYNGYSWFAEVSVASLPEGTYYIIASFMDKYNNTINTAKSNNFTIKHTIDLTNLQINYTGYMVQTLNISLIPVSTYTARGVIDNTEALY
ncbi:MAG: FG-GAP-like repeat-containing protein, partial [Candidatus Helarchaeota archaeon]